MQHLLFSIISAFIGLNFIAASAIQEQNPVTFGELGVESIMAHEDAITPSPNLLVPFASITPETTVGVASAHIEIVSSNEEDKKVDAYNTKSETDVTVSEKAVDHSKTLVPCTDEAAHCEPDFLVLQPSKTPSPTPTFIHITPTEPSFPIPLPIDRPCEPIGVDKEILHDELTRQPICIHENQL